jgi:hypothetical protein
LSKVRPRLHPDFVRAVRDSQSTLVALSALAGFAAYTQLSTVLCRKRVSASPVTQARIIKLAAVIGYVGPVFKEEAA